MHSTWRALLQNIELMPQDQVFGFQPLPRLEAVAQHADEEEANCDHQSQSCSDSVAAVTPADPVFGSDTCHRIMCKRTCGSILPPRRRSRGSAISPPSFPSTV